MRMKSCGQCAREGFTLIELMVVIAIIAVLAALLFPVFASARRESYRAPCTANLRQIGIAARLYAQDYGGYYPNGSDGSRGYGDIADKGPRYMDQLAAYVSSEAVYHCPIDHGMRVSEISYDSPEVGLPTRFAALRTSYSYEDTGSFPDPVPEDDTGGRDATTAQFWDASGSWHAGSRQAEPGQSSEEWVAAIDQGKFNTLFYDGHIRLLNEADWIYARFPLLQNP